MRPVGKSTRRAADPRPSVWREQDIVSALALGGGRWNFMSTHAMVHRKGEKNWITADIVLPAGNWYKHNLSRTDVDWTTPVQS